MFKHGVDIRIVRASLNPDNAIVKDWLLQYSRYQPSQIFRTIKYCKNLTFDAVSFFLLDDRMFLIAVVSLVKITLVSLFCLLVQNKHITLSLLSPYM